MPELTGYNVILLFLIGGVGFVLVTLLVGWILRPRRPNDEKLATYESGEETVGSAWGNFNVRFYVVGIIFLLFEVELIFLFPWAIVFGDNQLNNATNGLWGKFSLLETFVFVGLLAVGLIYVWKKGMLNWIKPQPRASDFQSKIPKTAYKHLMKK